MRINPVLLIIALAISGLAGYGFFAWNNGEPYQLLIAIGGGAAVFLPLGGLLALSENGWGTVGNIRALSAIFLVLEIISNIIFCIAKMTAPTAYIIVNGILILVYILISYAVSSSLKGNAVENPYNPRK
ncbi:MAG: hypothetical protein LBC83_01395 [Oscillospiraceae bacterium]|jgi:hypothetical protein|nr:hypothetical protein [Oscillospiraceae bacterium]